MRQKKDLLTTSYNMNWKQLFFRRVLVIAWLLLQYQYSCCSSWVPGYDQIFNKLLPAGSSSVCEKAPQALPLRYGRQHSHHLPWLRCLLGQSWKIPGSGQREGKWGGQESICYSCTHTTQVFQSSTRQQNITASKITCYKFSLEYPYCSLFLTS